VASKLTSSGTGLSSALLQQVALLSELPLSDRALKHQEVPQEINAFILEFCHEARKFVGLRGRRLSKVIPIATWRI
jgi:hypothetical protein